jgi:hypothetical protein
MHDKNIVFTCTSVILQRIRLTRASPCSSMLFILMVCKKSANVLLFVTMPIDRPCYFFYLEVISQALV